MTQGDCTHAGQLIQQALEHHQAGRLDQAASLYEQILRLDPAHADALHYSGLLAHQRGQTALALERMRQALEREPAREEFAVNLAAVLESAGELAEAAEAYRRVSTLQAQPAESLLKAANCLLRLDRPAEAAACCGAALQANPRFAQAVNSLGIALRRLGRLEQAIVCFRQATALAPGYADAFANLGLPLEELGRPEEALAAYAEAIRHDPHCVAAWCNRASALASTGKLEEAAQSARQAIQINPNHPESHLNLGNCLREMGQYVQAIDSYQRVVELDPRNAGAYSNLGDTLRDLGRIAEAAQSYRHALVADPTFQSAYSNLLYLHAFTRDVSPVAELAEARGWEKRVLSDEERAAARHRASPRSGVFAATPRVGRRLHLGIVSAELGTHAVAEFLQPFLEAMDKSRFRLTLFPTTARTGPRAEQLRTLADAIVPLVALPAALAADRIRAEAVDVLMDTTGHTSNGRLDIFAHRAAPVQLSYIGYWSTTGLTEMDWYPIEPSAPPALDAHFCEKLWRLPRVAQCYRGDHDLPASQWQPGPVLRLGSFNKFAKMREQTFELWGKVLAALPEARLVLEDRGPHEEDSHRRILAGLAVHGVAAERVEFIEAIPGHVRHMQLYDRLDIALDTIPFNSGTTAYDALWMGVPLVALEGDSNGALISAYALRGIGRPEWIARTQEEYVRIVCALAGNEELRRELRRTQRERMAASPLCDPLSLARELGEAFEQMYDRWLEQG